MKQRLIKIAVIAVAVFVLGGAVLHVAYQAFLRAAYPLKYEWIVNAYAAEYELPPSLIYAVIRTESRFREDAVSRVGAKGLMQLMDTTYEWIQTKIPGDPEPLEHIFDPEVNIRCGVKLLAVYHAMFSVRETVIAAYNAGSGTVAKWLADGRYSSDGKTLTHIPYAETEHYVERVLNAQKQYQALYGIE